MSWTSNREAAADAAMGKKVVALWVSPSENELRVVFENGTLAMDTEGDCCSESWWADAVGVKQLVGATVTGFEEIDVDLPEDDARTRQEEDVANGYRFKTDRGACDLIFRNSSNGYYGGWASFAWVDSPAGYFPEGYTQIEGDWSA